MAKPGNPASSPDINHLLEFIQPQCRDCIRPRLLGNEILAAGSATESLDWEKIRLIFVGYIALCRREEAPQANDNDPCLNMIEDRKCQFEELANMGKSEMGSQAESLIERSIL
jgi:hypothetical protein